MKKLILFSIFLFLFMQSCTDKETSGETFKDVPTVIDMDSVKRVFNINFKDVRYVPLETSDECLIGYASKVLIWNNRIYVADFHNAMALFIFDMNGKFLFKIAKRGQGPEEYVSFNDFDIQKNGDIYIFDLNGKKFLIYNSVGEYLYTINTDYYFEGFCLINEKMYWSGLYEHGKTFVNLAVYDTAKKKTEFVLTDEKLLHHLNWDISNYRFYYSPENIIYYSPKFSNIIFSIDNDGIRPAIGVKNLKMPSKELIDNWLLEKDILKRINMILSNRYFIENIYVYETDKYIMFKCIQGGEQNMIVYDKHSKNTCSVFMGFWDSLGISEAKGSTGKEFFGIVNFDSENKRHKEILKSREELKKWKEGDNPVIVFFNPDL